MADNRACLYCVPCRVAFIVFKRLGHAVYPAAGFSDEALEQFLHEHGGCQWDGLQLRWESNSDRRKRVPFRAKWVNVQ